MLSVTRGTGSRWVGEIRVNADQFLKRWRPGSFSHLISTTAMGALVVVIIKTSLFVLCHKSYGHVISAN